MLDRTLTSSVTDRLRADILSGEFRPGERLIEFRLTARYGVGRAAVRSSIVELAKEGLVIREVNRGATVREVSTEEAIEIIEARAALDALLAQHAANLANHEERKQLESIAQQLREAAERNDPVCYEDLDRQLFARIRVMSRQRVARQLVEALENQTAHHQDRVAMLPGRPQKSIEGHEAIVAAIVSGRAEDASTAVQKQLASTLEMLQQPGG